ncbi:MAG: hypothetical protein R3B84_16360 [Zavarzinella sp.]
MDGVRRIDRLVAEFSVWLDDSFPFAKIKVKVFERNPNNLIATANIAVRNLHTREPEYLSGLGETIEEATDDLLLRFVSEAREHTPSTGLTEDDFEWSCHEDF